VSILVAGHYCHDTLVSNAGVHRALGGSAAYASAVLEAAGVSYEVVSKAGRDFLYAAQVFRQPLITSERTTSFIDDYRFGERVSTVESVADPIEPADLRGRFAIGLACAVAAEIGPETLLQLRKICGLVLADAQGLLRRIGPRGEVELGPLPEGAAGCIDYLKASRSEAALLDVPLLRTRLTLLITDGSRGATLVTRSEETHVPAVPAVEVDATGAGDCFLAGFAVALSRGLAPLAAMRFANHCGALAVAQVGLPRLSAL
jgi:1D-myo-inositol 3-kinase